MIKKTLFRPEILFLIIALFWGTVFLFLNPIFQAPDEDAHLFKMWGYTIGSFNYKKENGWAGQILPKNLVTLQEYYNKYNFRPELKTNALETILASKVELKKEKTVFLRMIPTAYTPISYFPSFIVLFILKIFNAKPLAIFYILRFCSLLTYLALTYYAIKITPDKKWLFAAIGLLPLNLYQGAAISTDGITTGIAFLFIAYTLKLAFENEKINKSQIVKWGILILLLSLCKFVYTPLILLFFIIPKEKFESEKLRLKYLFSVFGITFLVITAFLIYTIIISSGAITKYTAITQDKFLLIKDIIIHPLTFLNAVFVTTKGYLSFFYQNVISSFGWDMVMIPVFATNLYYVLLSLTSIHQEKGFNFKIPDRAIILTTIVLSYLLIITSVYLTYQRYPVIVGMQGRYFAPLTPLIFLLFTNKFIKTNNKAVPIILVTISQFLLFTALLTLIARFY